MKYPYRCPKCLATHTWIISEGECLVQKCVCGLNKYLYFVSKDGQVTVMRTVVSQDEVQLPPQGTKSHTCLLVFLSHYPKPVTSGLVANAVRLKTKETSALLVSLMTRGLIVRLEERQGQLGGSSWMLSGRSIDLLRAKERVVHESEESTGPVVG